MQPKREQNALQQEIQQVERVPDVNADGEFYNLHLSGAKSKRKKEEKLSVWYVMDAFSLSLSQEV